jgi:hypothetical protein
VSYSSGSSLHIKGLNDRTAHACDGHVNDGLYHINPGDLILPKKKYGEIVSSSMGFKRVRLWAGTPSSDAAPEAIAVNRTRQ